MNKFNEQLASYKANIQLNIQRKQTKSKIIVGVCCRCLCDFFTTYLSFFHLFI